MRDTYDFDIETIGFEIHPETPTEGKALKDAFPGYEQMIGRLQTHAKARGAHIGDLTHLYNTRKALRLGELAKERGQGNEFSVLMYKAYFTDGLDISDDDLLIRQAAKLNIHRDEAVAAMKSPIFEARLKENSALGHKLKVTSVPSFLINDTYLVVGSDSQDEIAKVFDKLISSK